MSVSGNVVRLLQAQKLLFNIETSLKRCKETLKADPLWTKLIQTIETILEENCIDEDIIERLRSKKSRLELEIAKLQIKKLASPPPTPPRKTHFNTEEEVERREIHIALANVGTINKATIIENVEDKEVDDKVSGEKIQKLLQQQKDIHSKELAEEQRTKNALLQELTDLTGILKNSTLDINRSVLFQNQQLTDIQKFAFENQEEIENQKKKMAERTKGMTTSIWTSIATIAWIAFLFVVTYIVIRLFPKPSSEYFCEAKY
eukprot:gene14881-16560_t